MRTEEDILAPCHTAMLFSDRSCAEYSRSSTPSVLLLLRLPLRFQTSRSVDLKEDQRGCSAWARSDLVARLQLQGCQRESSCCSGVLQARQSKIIGHAERIGCTSGKIGDSRDLEYSIVAQFNVCERERYLEIFVEFLNRVRLPQFGGYREMIGDIFWGLQLLGWSILNHFGNTIAQSLFQEKVKEKR